MIKYQSGYKYRLYETVAHQLPFELIPDKPILNDFINISKKGILVIKAGYSWDGASGPTIDTKTSMRGSLIHDVIYQLMREGFISRDKREFADNEMRRIMVEDGMMKLRAKYFLLGVDKFGGKAAIQNKDIFIAP